MNSFQANICFIYPMKLSENESFSALTLPVPISDKEV